jgi:hypothetical protein
MPKVSPRIGVSQLFIALDDVQARIFRLPKWPSDREATEKMWITEFLPWARANGLRVTQINAVTKELNEHGYYIKGPVNRPSD